MAGNWNRGTRTATGVRIWVRCGGGLPAAFAPGAAPVPVCLVAPPDDIHKLRSKRRPTKYECEMREDLKSAWIFCAWPRKRERQRRRLRRRLRRNKPASRRVARQKDRQAGQGLALTWLTCLAGYLLGLFRLVAKRGY